MKRTEFFRLIEEKISSQNSDKTYIESTDVSSIIKGKAYCVDKPNLKGNRLKNNHFTNSAKTALRYEIYFSCHGKNKNGTYMNINENPDEPIFVMDKYKSELQKTVTIYEISGKSFGMDLRYDKYGAMIKDKTIDVKVFDEETDTIENLAKKHGIKIEIDSSKVDTNEVMRLSRQAITIFLAEYREVGKDFDFKKFFSMNNDLKTDVDEYADKESGTITICTWDLWNYTPKARDEKETNELWKNVKSLVKKVNERLKKLNMKVSIDGDWDTGSIELSFSKNMFESVNEAVENRKDLPDEIFGIPELRKFPLTDAEHVKLAIRFFNYAEPKYRKELAENIILYIDKYNVKIDSVSDKNKIKPYLVKAEII